MVTGPNSLRFEGPGEIGQKTEKSGSGRRPFTARAIARSAARSSSHSAPMAGLSRRACTKCGEALECLREWDSVGVPRVLGLQAPKRRRGVDHWGNHRPGDSFQLMPRRLETGYRGILGGNGKPIPGLAGARPIETWNRRKRPGGKDAMNGPASRPTRRPKRRSRRCTCTWDRRPGSCSVEAAPGTPRHGHDGPDRQGERAGCGLRLDSVSQWLSRRSPF